MATRYAHTAPGWSGLSFGGLGGIVRKVVAYLGLLVEAFAEAREEARAAQARRTFIEE
jgi:hypothetical protein